MEADTRTLWWLLAVAALTIVSLTGVLAMQWRNRRRSQSKIDLIRTEQDRHRDELERHRHALDLLPFPVWRRDRDLRLIQCNEAYARIVGVSIDECISAQREIAERIIEQGGRGLAQRARNVGHGQTESQYLIVDGARRLFEFVETPMNECVFGYAMDVTALTDLQGRLDHQAAAHAQVLESLSNGIAILGRDSRLKFFNQAFADMFAMNATYLRSEPPLAELLESIREARRLPEQTNFPGYKQELIRRIMGVVKHFDEVWHLPNDVTLRIVVTPHPLGDVIMIFDDVTDILTLEQSYNTLIEVQRESLDNLFESVAVLGSDGRLKLHNPAFAALWEFSDELLANQPHIIDLMDAARPLLIYQGDWGTFRSAIVAAVTSPATYVHRIERTDDRVVDFRSIPLPNGDFLASYIDVTDSVRIERALRERNDALEAADQLKSEFMANISYELRTPLNAIVGFAEILEHGYAGPMSDKQREYSRGIVEAARQLTLLIDNALDLTTIEAGFMQLDRKPINVGSLLHDVYDLAQERARGLHIALDLVLPDTSITVRADGRRLKQALYSLMTYALKVTPPGGRIELTARQDDDDIVFRVFSTGTGITPETRGLERANFANSADWSIRSPFGLALVKSLIELHGGRVEIDADLNAGTAVSCHIPLRRALPQEQASSLESS